MILRTIGRLLTTILLLLIPAIALAQTPPAPSDGLLKPEQLEALVAPIALYPDSLLSTVLMASTYPLEVVQARHPEMRVDVNLVDVVGVQEDDLAAHGHGGATAGARFVEGGIRIRPEVRGREVDGHEADTSARVGRPRADQRAARPRAEGEGDRRRVEPRGLSHTPQGRTFSRPRHRVAREEPGDRAEARRGPSGASK